MIMGDQGDGPTRRTIELSGGTIHYEESGEGEPLVFVHGFGVNGLLWRETAAALAPQHRCIVPDWPLGSHPEGMSPDADLTPPGVARMISEFIEALGLEDVTIVGNDSGGAVTQILVTEIPDRISRLVLTNCDCFEKFPPGHFKVLAKALKVPGTAYLAAQSMRLKVNRRSPLSYGALTVQPIDDAILRAWTEPQIRSAGVRRDSKRFFSSVDKRYTLRAATKLRDLGIPALIVWGDADRFFTIEDGRRLAELIPDSRIVEIPGGKTFLPLDDPQGVAAAIGSFVAEKPVGAAV
jgi:pimeloyl-ACP methyl ester carboxylesterase